MKSTAFALPFKGFLKAFLLNSECAFFIARRF